MKTNPTRGRVVIRRRPPPRPRSVPAAPTVVTEPPLGTVWPEIPPNTDIFVSGGFAGIIPSGAERRDTEEEIPMTEPAPVAVVTLDNPPVVSKINWANIISMAVALLATFGIAVPDTWQPIILQALLFITPIITIILRTWFTGKEATKPQLRAALADKA